MRDSESELDMVRRHVREGAARIARQCELIAFLKTSGGSTEKAETILFTFENIQDQHLAHLAHAENKPKRMDDAI